ncbi:MAG: molybdopterin-binding protein [Bacilli bacterium]|nr:molybdopterin-binding protein [Bacilli bacterium]
MQDAVGMVLAHDLTRIVPGQYKGVAFHKGYQIKQEDIPALLDIGKAHIYVLELKSGELHEDTAALRIEQALGAQRLVRKGPHEGKITVAAPYPGIVQIDEDHLFEINSIQDVVVSTRRNGDVVSAGQAVAAMRVVPLVVQEQKILQVEQIAQAAAAPLIDVYPFRPLKAGIVSTGSEILTGRIQDAFGPVLREKLAAYQSDIVGQQFTGDDTDVIEAQIRAYVQQGVDLVIATGGMSVDPDDRTPGAIARVADDVVTYGMPILPGSMMMVAYLGSIPIFGLPGAVIHDKRTAFDLLLPYVCAGLRITRPAIVKFGHGGLLN